LSCDAERRERAFVHAACRHRAGHAARLAPGSRSIFRSSPSARRRAQVRGSANTLTRPPRHSRARP
jgi:hypothetical protein